MKTCYFCKGPVKPERVDHMAKREGGYTLVKGLLVEMCRQCGEVYLDADALRRIDEAVADASEAPEHLEVPVVHATG